MNSLTNEVPIKVGFEFISTDAIFISQTENGKWDAGEIIPFQNLQVSPASAVFNYGQAIFEGLKAIKNQKGEVILFRPEMNAKRFQRSAERLLMPPYPIDGFIEAVKSVVQANIDWVPLYDRSLEITEQSALYIRPVMIGDGPVLGVGPAQHFIFYIFVCPVGAYLPGPGRVIVMDSFHRVPIGGLGAIKASSNYAGTMLPHKIACAEGYKDVLYLDAKSDQFVEELGSSNFFAIFPNNILVTPPLSGNILPGITRDSVMNIAHKVFEMEVEERPLCITDVLEKANEAFFTGTAAVIQPITEINYRGQNVIIGNGDTAQNIAAKLRRYLIGIQFGEIQDQWNWTIKIT